MAAWDVLTALFGNVDQKKVDTELRALSAAARDCAAKLRKGLEMDVDEITADEHRGDDALRRLSEAVEDTFIPRLTTSKADTTRLGHELDDAIDLMRDVAEHIATYRRFLPELPLAASTLIRIVNDAIERLDRLIKELTNGKIEFDTVNRLAKEISALERDADRTKNDAIGELVRRDHFADFREFGAQKDLIDLLEGITDHAKHCAVIVLSMARQEA